MQAEEIEEFLSRAMVGRVSTIGHDGYPYKVAVHFIWRRGKVWFHGLDRGQKLENIMHCPKACFELDEMTGLLVAHLQQPCNADTAYQSVVVTGQAAQVEDFLEKQEVLAALVEKYAPAYTGQALPEARVRGTAVIAITPERITGKRHSV